VDEEHLTIFLCIKNYLTYNITVKTISEEEDQSTANAFQDAPLIAQKV
jgi:hypothetical protein